MLLLMMWLSFLHGLVLCYHIYLLFDLCVLQVISEESATKCFSLITNSKLQ